MIEKLRSDLCAPDLGIALGWKAPASSLRAITAGHFCHLVLTALPLYTSSQMSSTHALGHVSQPRDSNESQIIRRQFGLLRHF